MHGRESVCAKVINNFAILSRQSNRSCLRFYEFLRFQSQFWCAWKLSHCFMNSVYFIQLLEGSGTHLKNISSNYWQLANPYKWIYDPIIGSLLHNFGLCCSRYPCANCHTFDPNIGCHLSLHPKISLYIILFLDAR